jgi:AcrR family transcriptional regulator
MSSRPEKLKGRFKRGEAAPEMRKVARQIIKKKGVAGLSFRTLAAELQLSHSAPLHHFGTIAGLLGAIAAEAFTELTHELKDDRESYEPSDEALARLAVRYASWARDNSNLYKAIHSPDLWDAVQAGRAPTKGRQNPPGRLARDRAMPSIVEANDARELAFHEFVQAAESDPSLRKRKKGKLSPEPVEVARMVTTLVDGYLFQLFNEFSLTNPPSDEIRKLVGLALRGVQSAP